MEASPDAGRNGVELWANRRLYVAGCRVGSPPDSFSPNGQDWSFPPPNRLAHLADGYRHFRRTIQHSARHGAALRIDHVMRLFRLYWIPDGRDARQGAYVRDFAGDLLRILALESHRSRVLIVGEDLGTVEPWMREELASFGILSYRVFYFERKPGGEFQSASEYPRQALVSSTTHDLPTLAGFWSGRDLEARHTLGLLGGAENQREWLAGRTSDKLRIIELLKREQLLPPDFPEPGAQSPELPGEIHNAITGFLASTPSMLMTLNQEDLTKELDQQNLPGTTSEYPNWRRRMLYTVEELRNDPMAKAYTSMLRNWLEKSGRVHRAPLKKSG